MPCRSGPASWSARSSARSGGWPTRASMASTGTGRRTTPLAVAAPDDVVRLLAPFDPVVWDRRRFEILWGWAYRFEAYTPVAKRKLGYYALPLLWRDRVIGWANLSVNERDAASGVRLRRRRPPRDRAFRRALEDELAAIALFLSLKILMRERHQGTRQRVTSGRSRTLRPTTLETDETPSDRSAMSHRALTGLDHLEAVSLSSLFEWIRGSVRCTFASSAARPVAGAAAIRARSLSRFFARC